MRNHNGSKGKWPNNKKSSQRKGSDVKPNATIAKKVLLFAPVSKNANFAPFDTVKDVFTLDVQQLELKAKALVVKCLQDEKKPDFRAMKPVRYKVTWDAQNNRVRTETMAVYSNRVTSEHTRVVTRQQGQQAAAQAQQEPELPESIKELIKDYQEDRDAEFESEKKKVNDLEQWWNNDILTVYAKLWEYTSPVLQKRLEGLADYQTRIHNDPIECLKEIKVQINDNTYSVHPAISMMNAVQRMLSMQQEPEQSVADYHKAFKARMDVTVTQAGNLFTDFVTFQLKPRIDLVKNDISKTEQQKQADIAVLIKKGTAETYAILFIENADKSKYGSLQKRFRGEYGQEKPNVYPLTLEAAVKTLNTHSWDPQYYENKKKAKLQAKEKQKQRERDPTPENLSSFVQKGKPIVCFICGKVNDHIKPNCNKKDLPKEQWWITKQASKQTHMQQGESLQQSQSDSNGQQQGNSDQNNGNTNQNQDQQQSGPQEQQNHTQRVTFRPRRGVSGFRFQGLQRPVQVKKCLFQTPHQVEEPSKPVVIEFDLDSDDGDNTSLPSLIPRADDDSSKSSDEASSEASSLPSSGPPGLMSRDDEASESSEETVETEISFDSDTTTLPNVQCHYMAEDHSIDDEDVCYLDSGSAIKGTWKNKNALSNIRPAENPIIMGTNAGSALLDTEGDVPRWGTVHVNENGLANILGLSEIAKKYRVYYDSDSENAFLVFHPDGIIKFSATEEGLYAHNPKDGVIEYAEYSTNETIVDIMKCLVNTVRENMEGFTAQQIVGAKMARDLYRHFQCPGYQAFKALLKMNVIRNCPITEEDASNAEKIFGPDVGLLKGKSKRPKQAAHKNEYIEIPKEIYANFNNLDLHIDLLHVNGLPHLTSIDGPIKYRTAVPLDSRTTEEFFRALDVVLRHYNSAGFEVAEIHADSEFDPMISEIKDELDIDFVPYGQGEHVKRAERNNQTIGGNVRAIYNSLPYKAWPNVMTRYAVMNAAENFTHFPAKGGVSAYYSPHMIMKKKPLDYNKHCKFNFGDYVQGFHENHPTNTNKERTVSAIYLRPTPNSLTCHDVMNLETGRVNKVIKVTQLPITDHVIAAVNAMAAEQGVKSLKIESRNKVPLLPADWIAGVDYEDTNQNNFSAWEDESVDGDYNAPKETRYEYERALNSSEQYVEIDEDELNAILADESAIDARLETAQELLGDDTSTASQETPQQANENESNPINSEEDIEITGVQGSETVDAEPRATRPSRNTQQPERMTYNKFGSPVGKSTSSHWQTLERKHNFITQGTPSMGELEYDMDEAILMARYIHHLNTIDAETGLCFAQQYMFEKGLKVFGDRGWEGGMKEIKQLHDRVAFEPRLVSELTPEEIEKAQEALLLLTEKRDQTVKGRMVYNGKPTRMWIDKEDAASPTVSTDSTVLTAVIDAKEGRDVMTNDIPNAFVQAPMPEENKKKGDRVIMKVTGRLVQLIVELDPELYTKFVVHEKGRPVIYLEVTKAIYGMLVASLLWYKKFRADLEGIGFVFNSYDPCVCNRMIGGKQHTVRFHVDDLMSSHVDPKVNDEFLIWLNKMYGDLTEVKCTRGPIHDFLGVVYDFSQPGKVMVDMIDYVQLMLDDFSIQFDEKAHTATAAAVNLFDVGTGDLLDAKQKQEYHTFVAKALFLCGRARPDIRQVVSVLSTRVQSPSQDDWKKLERLMLFLHSTKMDKLILSAEDLHIIRWWIDASFAVHPDFKSHTGAAMSFGLGAAISGSNKQKLNTRSSTTAELVGVDDIITKVMWTQLFMEEQGYEIEQNIVYQDNKSAMLLEKNGKRSSGKRTRALNIRYFFVTDQIEKGLLTVEYCPTGEMIADYIVGRTKLVLRYPLAYTTG